jgi:serine/threonine-protein kinase HipA
MAAQFKQQRQPLRRQFDVCLGQSERAVGRLVYVQDGQREFSQFVYDPKWLQDDACFDISPDLTRQLGYQLHKPSRKGESCFFMAMADTEPDAWGRKVIARAHAKARATSPSVSPLTELDFLAAVDDFSRVGALRLRDEQGNYLRNVQSGARSTPTFIELEQILSASTAVEMSQETIQDLAYLQGKGTSLGGMRPKCTILDVDGSLALGKFPSVSDERSVTRGEVLALRLAGLAGIEAAQSRVVMVRQQPVALINRFDRTQCQQRIPYVSGATMLQAKRDEERSYTELVDVMRSHCVHFVEDVRALWRRLVFNHLITNVDDHLQNIGFLYVGNNQWRLAPAFDLNPFPDKLAESKTWLSEDSGPIVSIDQLLSQAARFELTQTLAKSIVSQVSHAVVRWQSVALSPEVGLSSRELDDFRSAFRSDANPSL